MRYQNSKKPPIIVFVNQILQIFFLKGTIAVFYNKNPFKIDIGGPQKNCGKIAENCGKLREN